MTVQELIRRLLSIENQNLPVCAEGTEYTLPIDRVILTEIRDTDLAGTPISNPYECVVIQCGDGM